MSIVAPFRSAQLEETLRRFEAAALDHPGIEAVIEYRPDLRTEEAQIEADALCMFTADLSSENINEALLAENDSNYRAGQLAVACEQWIPPIEQSTAEQGLQGYGSFDLRTGTADQLLSLTPPQFRCGLFGPPAPDGERAAAHALFKQLASLAVPLLGLTSPDPEWTHLGGSHNVKTLLVHLVEHAEQKGALRLKQRLSWGSPGHPRPPMWGPVTLANFPNGPVNWWVARLPNVFHQSAIVLAQHVQAAAWVDSPLIDGEPGSLSHSHIVTNSDHKVRADNVGERMRRMVDRNEEDCFEWTAEEFAERLGCAKSTIIGGSGKKVWDTLMKARAFKKADEVGRRQSRPSDRRRKPKKQSSAES